jgi:hypothetical protein
MNKPAPFAVRVLKPYRHTLIWGSLDRSKGELHPYYIRGFAEYEVRSAPAGHAELLILQPSGEYASAAA